MATSIFAIVSLCLAFSVYGVPVNVKIAPPQPSVEMESVYNGMNPQQTAGHFEGDMIFADGYDPTNPSRGVAIHGDHYRWPNGVIPYDISAINDAKDQKTITDAMQTLMYDVATPKANTAERTACIYFRPRQSTDKVYFKIQYGNGCSANVRYLPNYQSTMTLQKNGCFYSRIVQHELMHVVGFFHEQSRPDRDDFLHIDLSPVKAGMEHNFNKYAWGQSVTNQGFPYDYASIMHYETTAFSTNGKPTMTPKKNGVAIGKSERLSATDIAEVRHLYKCK